MQTAEARKVFDYYWNHQDDIAPDAVPVDLDKALSWLIRELENGTVRVASPTSDGWMTHGWVQSGILLLFRSRRSQSMTGTLQCWYDKIQLQSAGEPDYWSRRHCRVAPPATVREGAHIGPRTVLMPCYVNIGAYIGEDCLIDTWSTIGSGAQIGNRVHVSGGVGIGGVLEPIQSAPVIIEDDCFIGARSEIAEGITVHQGAVLAMGLYLGASTRIVDRQSGTVSYGHVPENAVVVPGTCPGRDGTFALNCAVIVKRVDAKTRRRIGLNAILRDLE
ncbi:MAG: 2,3,4,5-tetrahydropyridine-2,6-dicarboxylate N-succinyltransferase [Gammaproteobacteria bacterium]